LDAATLAEKISGRSQLLPILMLRENKEGDPGSLAVQKPLVRTAHIVLSLKRPEEVATLRKVYGDGFFLVGVFATEKERLEHLLNQNAPKQDETDLTKRDSEEQEPPSLASFFPGWARHSVGRAQSMRHGCRGSF
jgi:hypothetical protein